MNKVEDFIEYKIFFEKNGIDIQEFVLHLNIVTEYKTCGLVSDYTKVMIHLFKMGQSRFLKEITNVKVFNNYKILYLYFKFLLLEPKEKEKIYKEYITFIIELKESIMPTINEEIKMSSWQKIMENIYRYMNDECIEKFMDCFINKEYVQLNTQDMSFTEYNKEYFLTNKFFFKFNIFVLTHQMLHFIYNLNYCLSNTPTYKSMQEYEGQILSGTQDFCKRFNENIDKFIILYNYEYYQYTDEVNKRYITEMCSYELEFYVKNILEISSANKIIGCNLEITKENKEYHIRKLIYSMLDIISVSERYLNVRFVELSHYLKIVIEYNKYFSSDEYRLLELVKNDPYDTSKIFKNLYDSFCVSDTYNSLVYLLTKVYNKLLLNDLLDEKEVVLKKYLENVFEYTYNFCQWHYCSTELDKLKK